jgi:hypothetical protein
VDFESRRWMPWGTVNCSPLARVISRVLMSRLQ